MGKLGIGRKRFLKNGMKSWALSILSLKNMKIRELLTDDSKWTKRTMYRDNLQNPTSDRKKAVSFCLVGAICFCYGLVDEEAEKDRIYDLIYDELSLWEFGRLDSWNDQPQRTFEDIKNLIEKLDI